MAQDVVKMAGSGFANCFKSTLVTPIQFQFCAVCVLFDIFLYIIYIVIYRGARIIIFSSANTWNRWNAFEFDFRVAYVLFDIFLYIYRLNCYLSRYANHYLFRCKWIKSVKSALDVDFDLWKIRFCVFRGKVNANIPQVLLMFNAYVVVRNWSSHAWNSARITITDVVWFTRLASLAAAVR